MHDKTPLHKLVRETVSDWPWWRELAASEEFQGMLQQEDAMYKGMLFVAELLNRLSGTAMWEKNEKTRS